jgi:Tfp pilus assembly protein PilF
LGVLLALSCIGLQDFDQAIQHLYLLTNGDDASLNSLAYDIEVYLLRAKLYYQQEKIFYCFADLKSAMEIDPSHPAIHELQVKVMEFAVRFKNQASEQVIRKDWNLAVWYLNQAIELDPDDWKIQILRGVLLGRLGQNEQGVEDLTEVYTRSDREGDGEEEVKFNLAILHGKVAVELCDRGNSKDALARFQIALNFNKRDVVILENRAQCHKSLGDFGLCIQDLNEILKLQPNLVAIKEKLASVHIELAKMELKKLHYQEAIGFATMAIEQSPQTGDYYFERSRAHFYLQVSRSL